MLDPVTITIIVGLVTLVVERIYKYMIKIERSKCCGNITEIEMKN